VVIKLEPGNAGAYASRGLAFADNGQLNKAISDCTEAIRLDPKLGAAYHGRGRAYEKKGDKPKAAEDFAQAQKLGYQPLPKP
jgi:Flp pilus assembly protein TadD